MFQKNGPKVVTSQFLFAWSVALSCSQWICTYIYIYIYMYCICTVYIYIWTANKQRKGSNLWPVIWKQQRWHFSTTRASKGHGTDRWGPFSMQVSFVHTEGSAAWAVALNKPSILGYPYFWKHPYIYTQYMLCWTLHDFLHLAIELHHIHH